MTEWHEGPLYLSQLLSRPDISTKLKPEDALTVKVADMLRTASVDQRLACVWFHVGNEGKRGKLAGAIQKAKGVVPGVYDFAFIGAQSGFIEIKVKAPISDNQKAFARWCSEVQVRHAVCRSVKEVELTLQIWGLLCHK